MSTANGVGTRRWIARAAASVLAVGALVFTLIVPAQAAVATSSISGHVVDKATGEPLAGVTVSTQIDSTYGAANDGSAVTDAAGAYTISGLEPGVRFVEFSGPQPYAQEFWPDAPKMQAARVQTSAGQHVTGTDASLQAAVSLSGTATRAATGAPIHGLVVDLYNEAGYAGFVFTDRAGQFFAPGLIPGKYRLEFDTDHFGDLPDLVTQFWAEALTLPDATPITLEPGAARTDIDVAMVDGAEIQGTVTDAATGAPVGDARVDAAGPNSVGTTTDSAGHYLLVGLAAGSYTVTARPVQGSGAAEDLLPETRSTVVTTGAMSDLDLALQSGGHIAGTVRSEATGAAGDWADVTAYRWDAGQAQWVTQLTGRVYGDYTLGTGFWTGAVPAGDYVVAFSHDGLCTEYWDGAFAKESAKHLTVVAHQTTKGIDAYLTKACSDPAITAGTVSISGGVAANSKLTAALSGWKPAAAKFAYRWFSVSGATSTPIAGATAATFTPTSAQVGKSLKVTVTASPPGTPTVTRTSAVTGKVAIASTPTISGTRAYLFALTAHPGTWTKGTTFTYQWYAGGRAISGARSARLTLGNDEVFENITVKVTGHLSGYATVPKTSAATARIALTTAPSISGTRRVGSTLTAQVHASEWTIGTKFTYRWYASGAAISGATHSTLRLTSAQRGKTITVKVTGQVTGYATITRTSPSTARIG